MSEQTEKQWDIKQNNYYHNNKYYIHINNDFVTFYDCKIVYGSIPEIAIKKANREYEKMRKEAPKRQLHYNEIEAKRKLDYDNLSEDEKNQPCF